MAKAETRHFICAKKQDEDLGKGKQIWLIQLPGGVFGHTDHIIPGYLDLECIYELARTHITLYKIISILSFIYSMAEYF